MEGGHSETPLGTEPALFLELSNSSTSRTLRLWCCSGPGFRSARQMGRCQAHCRSDFWACGQWFGRRQITGKGSGTLEAAAVSIIQGTAWRVFFFQGVLIFILSFLYLLIFLFLRKPGTLKKQKTIKKIKLALEGPNWHLTEALGEPCLNNTNATAKTAAWHCSNNSS